MGVLRFFGVCNFLGYEWTKFGTQKWVISWERYKEKISWAHYTLAFAIFSNSYNSGRYIL